VKKIGGGDADAAAALVSDIVEVGAIDPFGTPQVVDLETRRIMSKYEYEREQWIEMLSSAGDSTLERRLHALALILFRRIKNTSKTAASFRVRRDEVLDQLREMSVVVRLDWPSAEEDFAPRLDPWLEEDDQESGTWRDLGRRFQSAVNAYLKDAIGAWRKGRVQPTFGDPDNIRWFALTLSDVEDGLL